MHACNQYVSIYWPTQEAMFFSLPSLPSQDINLKGLGTQKPFIMLNEKNSTFEVSEGLDLSLCKSVFGYHRTQKNTHTRASECSYTMWLGCVSSRQQQVRQDCEVKAQPCLPEMMCETWKVSRELDFKLAGFDTHPTQCWFLAHRSSPA